ncbi:hypothetical protein J3E64_000185 [Sphingobium sp. OAS761]|uniref:hypothetical protein n=1 Tax=Sphingobium sp. OAS761 TaxID=2817901 RepID=UPI0020A03792|nr:hypothetical protein [Sphingobium sp. OAS761]MCP1468518.1 hypothetical protein [Sphingobium sp. OAS761]
MTIRWPFGTILPLILQCGLILLGMVALYVVPPAEGLMLLVPITQNSRAWLASEAVAHGARLVAAGPWAGTLVVEGRRDRIGGPMLRRGVIAIGARATACGEPG